MKHVFSTALVAASLAVAAPAFADPVQINAVTFAPRQASITQPFAQFVEEVNEMFAGEIEITWRGGPEVMPPFGQPEGVRNGAMGMTYTSPSYYQGLVPTSGTMNLSFMNYEEIAATDYHERMTELHAEQDLAFVGEIPATQLNFQIYMSGEITSLADLEGQRIRVFPALLPLVEALGAEPIVLPMPEIYTAMERGAIDGFMQGPNGGQAEQFEGIVSTVVQPGVYRAGFPVLMNMDLWNEMSPDLQERFTTFLREDFAPRMDFIWTEDITTERAAQEAAGFEFFVLEGEDAAAYEALAMDAAWATVAETAGEEIAAELRGMLDRQ
ncbi:TRAP transporter substrate-binding protein DctP [Nioella ostreopsis]|uniref:TRAP transporter substrate-binding protein DctP n=1 Tax=Nioella ostreopsis TaxID=2448479 RepID=UPI0013DFB545|nr:TRAP transporter substrate-binding protein DctP [Nioella ostreopsis]